MNNKIELFKYAETLQNEIVELIHELCLIPAPSNQEEKRAEFCRNWFIKNNFSNVSIDSALNVLAPVGVTADNQIAVIMAHTDTVFPDLNPLPYNESGNVIAAPGVADDTANLAVLMVCARIFKEHYTGKRGVLFVANSGEEGLGNLKGCRKIIETYGSRITELISLDHGSLGNMITKAVGSHRYRLTINTEGGHSFNNFGNRNAIRVLASMIDTLYTVKVPVEGNSKTTYNVGTISGGTSVNTIAQSCEAMYEYRSDSRVCLEKMQNLFENVVEAYRAMEVEIIVEKIGDRPCSGNINQADFDNLINRVKEASKNIGIEDMTESSGSTDCNIPLATGIPAVCFGVCKARGGHTREEQLEKDSLLPGTRRFLDFIQRSYL